MEGSSSNWNVLGSTAWRGGEIVYRYGIGVMSLPQTSVDDKDGHEHSHDSMDDKSINTDTMSSDMDNVPHNKGEQMHDH